jgi:Zn-dependent protease with chaperone function
MTDFAMPQPAVSPSSVRRWETEIPLLVLVIVASIVLWILVAVSVIGIFYAVFFSLFFLLAQVGFIAHLRGSAIKLGPQQMPELYARVVAIASRIGLAKVPDAYLMQAGGSLNAMATKLFRSNFIVLYSDLVEACGDDAEAVDFIVGHELGHVKAGHLRFQWAIILGRLVPFLGGAYSRAREYTADRYGLAGITDPHGATRGLTVLAAGAGHAHRVNLAAMLQQRHDMASVWMTIGRWMSTHPPLVDRIAELDKAAGGERIVATRAVLGAVALLAFAFVLPMVGGSFLIRKFMTTIQNKPRPRRPARGRPPAPAPKCRSVRKWSSPTSRLRRRGRRKRCASSLTAPTDTARRRAGIRKTRSRCTRCGVWNIRAIPSCAIHSIPRVTDTRSRMASTRSGAPAARATTSRCE